MILSDITNKLKMPREPCERKAPEIFSHSDDHVLQAEQKRKSREEAKKKEQRRGAKEGGGSEEE